MNIQKELKNSSYLKGVINPPEKEHEKFLADLLLGKIDVLITQFQPTYRIEEKPKMLETSLATACVRPGTYSKWKEVEEEDVFKTIVIISCFNDNNWKGQAAISELVTKYQKKGEAKVRNWGPFEVMSFKKSPEKIAEIMLDAANLRHVVEAIF